MRWSAVSWRMYSPMSSSPYDRFTVPPRGSWSATAASASSAAAWATVCGYSPSKSPSSELPTSAMVLRSTKGLVHRSSPTTWLTSWRTFQSPQGVGADQSPVACDTVDAQNSTLRRYVVPRSMALLRCGPADRFLSDERGVQRRMPTLRDISLAATAIAVTGRPTTCRQVRTAVTRADLGGV